MEYVEKQTQWMKEHEIAKGSLVRVTSRAYDFEEGWDNTWMSIMGTAEVYEVASTDDMDAEGILLREVDGIKDYRYPYFVLEPVCSILSIAKAAHNVNKAYCEGCGDKSQPDWTDAQPWQMASIIEGVKLIIKDPTTTPEKSHESWLENKKANGWKYGKEKSVSRKTHPCMVPYENLPESQRTKDLLFGAVVRGMLSLPRSKNEN